MAPATLAITAALVSALSSGALAGEQADEAYRRLLDNSQKEQHVRTLELGEAFLAGHPDHPEIASALQIAARAGIASSNLDRAAPLFRRIMEDHPEFDAIDDVRLELSSCLSGMRALEECIRLCRENLEAAPDSRHADYWHFLIPQSQFRLWRFKQAEEGLQKFVANHPRSKYTAHARRYLEKIDPAWELDQNGIGEYSGKYDGDYRLKAALAALPDHIAEGREKIRERLGIDVDFSSKVNFIFRDAGDDKRGGLMAEAYTISRDYKPVTVIRFYAEHVVIDPDGFRRTVIHEMKHAGFKTLMGESYDDLPVWIKEGLAQWAAGELEGRIGSKLGNDTFAGKDPFSRMNGVANPSHDLGDYLEDVLAFEWLEQQRQGNVAAFSRRLVKGDPWPDVLAATSGLDTDEAIRRMDCHCRDRVAGELGRAGRDALALRDTFFAKGAKGSAALREWLRKDGNRRFAGWLDEHPGHVLEPVLRFYTGRGLILAGEFAEGRKWLRSIIDANDGSRLCDDSLYWEGYAFQQEKRMDDAARSFGVLLRDYSWSNSAPKVRDKFEPAGPEAKPDSRPPETP